MLTVITETGNTFVIYNNIKQLPITRYNEVQKYLLMESGVGSDMEGISARFSRLHAFLAEGKIEESKKEAENLYYTHYSIIEGINFKSYAFCCLIDSIDGIKVTDYSEDGIKLILKQIDDTRLTQEIMEQTLADVKKKSLTN